MSDGLDAFVRFIPYLVGMVVIRYVVWNGLKWLQRYWLQ